MTKETAEPPPRRGSATAAAPISATCSGGQTTAQFLLDPRGQSGVLTHSPARGTAQPQGGPPPWTPQGPQTRWGIGSGLGVQVTGSHQIHNQALEMLYRICLRGSFSIQKP